MSRQKKNQSAAFLQSHALSNGIESKRIPYYRIRPFPDL